MLPRVSIIVLNYNGLRDTLECLNSLQHCTYPFFEIIVVDNASQHDEGKKLQQYKDDRLTVLLQKTNLGFAEGNNVAIRHIISEGKSSYIYFLNNDTVVEPDFLEYAIQRAETDSVIGIINSCIVQYHNRKLLDTIGHTFLISGDIIPRGRDKSRTKFPMSIDTFGACSAGALYRVKTLQECGLYDKDFFLNYEDVDLSYRCILYGWRCVYEPLSVIYHKGGSSISKIRDYPYVLRSQYNSLKAYVYNTPVPVLLYNMPFVLLRDISVILIDILCLKWTIVKVFLHARIKVIQNFSAIWREHKERMAHRKISSWSIMRQQKSFIGTYIGYFVDIVIKGRKSVFEKVKGK